MDLFVLFNVPVLRQLFSFVFLALVPGFLILTVLKLNKLGTVEKIILSVGLSVSCIMLFALLVNYVFLTIGYPKPLSTIPVLVSFTIGALVLAIFAGRRNKALTFRFPGLGLTTREKALLIVSSLFPLLSIIGSRLMNTTGNNILLMSLLLIIPAFVIFIAVYESKVTERLYPAFIFLIGISILLPLSLRGNHITGADIHESYYFFQATVNNQYWSVITPSLIDSLLSISILPSIYQIFMKMNPEYLYKLLYPLVFSISPLIIYVIAKKYLGGFYAFVSSLLFMSQFLFMWTTATSQTSLAILFFALAMMVHFQDGINEFARRLFFLIFAVSSIVSHYSTGYIFFIVVLLTWIGNHALHWVHLNWRKGTFITEALTAGDIDASSTTDEPADSSLGDPVTRDKLHSSSQGTGMSITAILLFFVVIFLWHAQITKVAFDMAVGLINRTLLSLHQSFIMETKDTQVIGAFAQSVLPSIPQQIRFVFSWLTVIFVAVGGLSIAARYKSAVAYPDSGHTRATFLKSKFELEYFVISGVCGVILAGAVVVPFISKAYGMERPYFQALVILSPYFVICGITIARLLRTKPYLIILPVLIPYFMCITGTMYQLFSVPASLILNSTGREYESLYISDEISNSARWLAQNNAGAPIYTDFYKPSILASQGGIQMARIQGSLVPTSRIGNGYVYLFYPQVVKGEVAPSAWAKAVDIEPLPEVLAIRNAIFNNGSVEIYR